MTIADNKFSESDFSAVGASSLPDRPKEAGMTATQVKTTLDYIGKTMIALGNFNDLIDALLATTTGDSGAANIGSEAISGVTGATVRAQLINLKTQLDNAIIGEFSPSGITNDMLATDIKIGSLAALATTIKTSLVNAVNELDTLKADEKITFAAPDTASRTFTINDRYKWVKANHASEAINYTVPPETDVVWEEGDWIIIDQIGAAQAAVVAGSDVTFRPSDKLKVNGQNTQMVLTYDGSNVWCVGGSRKV